jgi:hypothetical protein
MQNTKQNSAKNKGENENAEKVSDSECENPESEDVFTQDDFEDALKRVSRRISEPDEETT